MAGRAETSNIAALPAIAWLAAQIRFIRIPESSAINDSTPGKGDVLRICHVLGVVRDCQKRAILF
ncbi:hypothetical protein EOA30_00450 [Mesorhizobium sp. M8A.F.Ca.ET.059.01.1.1]|nr:hypothetical protein EOA30_00450 [Mesorhizobium sp. M8A.F.Ca.ET.059.01.1.1]